MAKQTTLNSVEEVIEDFRNGKIVIVVDDEDRENEGDFIVAAEKITPEIVNFMLKEGRGVLCAPLSEERCAQLELNMMEENNTSLLGTPFTVTADLLGHGRRDDGAVEPGVAAAHPDLRRRTGVGSAHVRALGASRRFGGLLECRFGNARVLSSCELVGHGRTLPHASDIMTPS